MYVYIAAADFPEWIANLKEMLSLDLTSDSVKVGSCPADCGDKMAHGCSEVRTLNVASAILILSFAGLGASVAI